MRVELEQLWNLLSAFILPALGSLPVGRARRAISAMFAIVLIIVVIVAGIAIIYIIVVLPGTVSTSTIYP